MDVNVSPSTLTRWKDSHAERYEAIRSEVIPKLRQEQAERHDALADQEMEVNAKLIERMAEESKDVPARDLPGAIRNLDVGTGINHDKASSLRNDAPPAPAPPDLKEVMRSLRAAGVTRVQIVEDEDDHRQIDPGPPSIEGQAEELDK